MNEWEYIDCSKKGPIIIFAKDRSIKPISWLNDNRDNIDNMLNKHGGILLRDFDIHSLREFNQFSLGMSPNLLEYVNRSTPRTRLGGKIYSATEYPADRHIQLHNENSYSGVWPRIILFFCAISPDSGGFTPIANSANVIKHIDNDLVEKCSNHGIKYVRNYHSGLDLSWQEVFQTTKKDHVEKYCQSHNIKFQWLDGQPELTTIQTRQAVLYHENTNQNVWFNQAHLFNIYNLPKDIRETLAKETNGAYPRNSYFGNGDEFSSQEIQNIIDAYDKEKIQFSWHRGDILILDNILMAHGRTPFSGERKIAVSMY